MVKDILRPWQAAYPSGISVDYDPPPMTLAELFLAATERYGNRVAISYAGENVTYSMLRAQVLALAESLSRKGVGPGQTVALLLPNCLHHPLFFFATVTNGARLTHLSPLDAIRELEHKCHDSDARLLVTLDCEPYLANGLALLEGGFVDEIILCRDPLSEPGDWPDRPEITCAEKLISSGNPGAAPSCQSKPEEVALLQYTGGTTGQPKAAMLSHRNLTASAQIYAHWFSPESDGTARNVLVCAPFFHIQGLTTGLLRHLHEGSRIVLHQRFDARTVMATLASEDITDFSGVPTMWIGLSAFDRAMWQRCTALRYIGSGAAPLPPDLHRKILHLTGLGLRGGWGMTETSPAGTHVPPGLPDDKIGTIGVPLPGVDIVIADKDDAGRLMPMGEAGEMLIRGPNVTSGYWKRPEETADAFDDGWFLTGDIARMDADGYFYVLDRKKDLILSGGFNVYPQAVENAIRRHPDVAEVLVVGVPDAYRGESAKAHIVLRPGCPTLTLDALRDFLAPHLGRHELPAALAIRQTLPTSGVGKYSRKALRDEAANAVDSLHLGVKSQDT
ncbi:MAG: AMP-binding protein [Mesorhizobium sp.]|nr:AMP-binding protein [Mesorhizobium sp.]